MLTTTQLQIQIRDKILLRALDWQVDPGQCWCVIGRNGAGKSTLLDTLAGMRVATKGHIQIAGRAVQDWPPGALARQRAYLPQTRSDAFSYSVLDTVLAARHPYQAAHYWETDADHQIAFIALQQLDVDTLAARDIRTLSGGERQRVAIAAILAQDTPLMILDEPTSALDLAHQVSVMRLLTRLRKISGKAIVMAGHDLNQLRAVATHALMLMPGGEPVAGPIELVMTATMLSDCLGHRVERVQIGDRILFVPGEGST